MKKVAFLLLAISLFFACQKEVENTEVDTLAFKRLDQTLEQIISNAQSVEDKRVRMVQHIFGEAMAELFRNNRYVKLAIEDTKNSPLRAADFNRLRESDANFKTDLDNLLLKHFQLSNFFSGKMEDENIYYFLVSQLTYDIDYEAKIVIPNLKVMNSDLDAITSSGLDLEDDDWEDHDEAIWAKKYHPLSQELIDIILKEQEALMCINPIFIFANGENEDQYIGQQIFGESLHEDISYKTESVQSTMMFSHQDMNIKSDAYHYDPSGKNEYCYTGVYYTNQNSWGWITLENSSDLSKRVTRFKKSECNGVDRTVWGEVYYANTHSPAPAPEHRVFFNTFERDWYQTPKYLGTHTHEVSGASATLVGKRKYNSEWYLHEHGIVLLGGNVPIGAYIDIQSYKSKFQITRIQ